MAEVVLYEKRGQIGVITLNRPEVLNAENDELQSGLAEKLRLAKDDDARVIILRGAGKSFCAGLDRKAGTKQRTILEFAKRIEQTQSLSRLISDLGKPIIAQVQGYALGAGFEYTLFCDLRVAADNAKFGFPEVSVGGMITNAGTRNLARIIGLGRAKQMAFTAKMIDAQTAQNWGLVNEVVPLDKLEETVMNLANQIAANFPLQVHLARLTLDRGLEIDLESVLRLEELAACVSFASGERQQGMAKKE